jgi:hypothetical protein
VVLGHGKRRHAGTEALKAEGASPSPRTIRPGTTPCPAARSPRAWWTGCSLRPTSPRNWTASRSIPTARPGARCRGGR